jgi:DNA-binding MarR family transcriptional regulator
MTPAVPLTLDDHLCFSLYSAAMAVGRSYKPLLDKLGLTYPQYLVLSTLWERDKQNVGAIADRLTLESSTVTPLIRRLVAADLVHRERNPQDDRQVLVSLTERGRDMCVQSTCLAEQLLTATGMTMERLMGIAKDVRAVRDAVAAH